MSDFSAVSIAFVAVCVILSLPFLLAVSVKLVFYLSPFSGRVWSLISRPVVWYLMAVNRALRWAGDLAIEQSVYRDVNTKESEW